MQKSTSVLTVVAILSLNLIVSCATLRQSEKPSQVTGQQSSTPNSSSPSIPFDSERAFYPIHHSLEGIFYPYEECSWLGLKCVYKETFIRFDDKEKMKWFFDQDFGFKKRARP